MKKRKIYFNQLNLGKIWSRNTLKYFTFPRRMTRNQALIFCSNNNGTLMYWYNATEQNTLEG